MRTLIIALASAALGAGAMLFLTEETRGAAERRFLNLPGRSDDNPYSNAVLVGDTLYLAGDIGIEDATGRPPEDPREEARIVMERMKQRLEMVGMTMEDLVMVEVHCPDLSLYADFNEVYRSYFGESFPARAFLGSGPLLLGGRFEVTATAVRR